VASQPRRILIAMPDRCTVLIVADDLSNCRGLVGILSDQPAFRVVGPLAALEALRFCSTVIPAVILLHTQLKGISAAEFCALVRGRANGSRFSPLLFGPVPGPRAATGSAFAVGEEYLSRDLKSASVQIEALAQQTAEKTEQPIAHYHGRHLEAHFDRVEIIVDGARTDLTRRELELLRFLVTHPNRVLSRADMLSHVWRNENDGRSRTVDVHIRRLRMKLGAAGEQIQTIPGVGYRFREE
jgi:two-component system, OmpR family, alkaline phosphatase synthesis response regulator PhoP